MGRLIIAGIIITGLIFIGLAVNDWLKSTPNNEDVESKIKDGEKAKETISELNKKYNKKK